LGKPNVPRVCIRCRTVFLTWPSYIRAGRKYCSQACSITAQRDAAEQPDQQQSRHYWKHVVIKESGCWEWDGPVLTKGYGAVTCTGRVQSAHRVSYRIHVGPIPNGLWVLHHCDNPPCSNPEHLYLGGPKENSRDMALRGRSVKGRSIPHPTIGGDNHYLRRHPEKIKRGSQKSTSKLTEDDVIQIRHLYATGTYRQVDLASTYGVTQEVISSVVLRKTWRHVSE
jgi:Autographiviridae endonuclease